MLEKYLRNANRDSGNWLPNVNRCPDRLSPCGNPRCVDMTLAAASISGRDYAHSVESGRILAEAMETARQCRAKTCPLGDCPTTELYILFELFAQ